jgi:hypothetical protein
MNGERIAFLVENGYGLRRYAESDASIFCWDWILTIFSDLTFYSLGACSCVASFSCISGTRIAIYYGP